MKKLGKYDFRNITRDAHAKPASRKDTKPQLYVCPVQSKRCVGTIAAIRVNRVCTPCGKLLRQYNGS